MNIRRVESAVPSEPGAELRSIHSKDRFFEITDFARRQNVLYYFRGFDQDVPRIMNVPPLQNAPELNVFSTDLTCSRFAFVGEGMHVEVSPSPTEAGIHILVRLVLTHVNGGRLNLRIRHRWIVPTSTPGVSHTLQGIFRFVRDQSAGPRKTPDTFI